MPYVNYYYGVKQFQFTHPGRGATEVSQADKERILFQFTHPGRGATNSANSNDNNDNGFNSRTPGGVRHKACATSCDTEVSIHAPREGCDLLQR